MTLQNLSKVLVVVCALAAMPVEAQGQNLSRDEKADVQAKGAATAGALLCFVSFVIVMLVFDAFPVIIALMRGHPDTVAIALVTLFFGWTGIGWMIAMIWAVKAFRREDD